jgi:hypothetical protein
LPGVRVVRVGRVVRGSEGVQAAERVPETLS